MNILIIGAGKMGRKLSSAFLEGGHSVTVIDQNEKTLESLGLQLDIMTILGNAKEISVLKDLHVSTFDYLLALTGNDDLNIIVSSFAKKLGCKNVIARVRDPEYMGQLDFIRETMAIDHMINPDMAITNEI